MFEIPANPNTGHAKQQCYSFEETAASMECGVGDLQRTMHTLRARIGGLTGFRALNLADVKRLLADVHPGKPSPALPTLAGFDQLVAFDVAERAMGAGGIAFQEALARLKIAVLKVECLNATGHRYALEKLRYLKDDMPPPGIAGNAIRTADWRSARASAKFEAEVAASQNPSKAKPRRRASEDVYRGLYPVQPMAAPDPLAGF